MDQKEISHNLKDVNQWLRVAYMVLFAVCLYLASAVLYLVAFVQAIFAVITGSANPNLRKLGACLSAYVHQLAGYLTYTHEEKPFPFASWPDVTPEPMPVVEPSVAEATAPAASDKPAAEEKTAGADTSEKA